MAQAPVILKYIPFANLMIAAIGFSAGLAYMTDSNLLFDGASLGMHIPFERKCSIQTANGFLFPFKVLMLFALSTHATSVRPGKSIKHHVNQNGR